MFVFFLFFFNDTATTEIYTLSLHDALPISSTLAHRLAQRELSRMSEFLKELGEGGEAIYDGEDRDWLLGLTYSAEKRSEEHTSELQSQFHLVCRLLLEKKKKKRIQERKHRL